MCFGRPPTLWWLLIVAAGPPLSDTGFDDVGVERALREELDLAVLLALHLGDGALEYVDELVADDLALAARGR
jgi:hypothetical protein